MSRVLLSVFAVISFCATSWASDVVEDMALLAQGGVGEDVLLARVETSASIPSLSTQDILRLKERRVSDRVIAAMIRRSTATSAQVDYTASTHISEATEPVIGTPAPLAAAPAPQQVIQVQRSAPVVYTQPQQVVYSQPVVYSSPVVYAGYSYPSYRGGYYGGYYGRPYYSGYYGGGYCGPRYYGGGHYHGHSHGGSFGISAGFRF